MAMSHDSNYYICDTYDKALRNNRMPCQEVANKLFVEDLPKPFQGIDRLERLPASRRILFTKVTIMPKGHVISEAVRPVLVVQFFEFLKLYNHLYSDIEINYNNIPADMLGCHNEKLEKSKIYLQLLRSLDEPIEVEVKLSTNKEIDEDPLSKFRALSVETTIISKAPSNFELEQEITIAPREGKQPVLVLNDNFCEELAHLHLFPSGRYGY